MSNQDPNWWRQAAVYQIYPRSFADNNNDGLGDLPGVTSRIPYLKELGVDAIWLSPFYPSALADGGYDVDDYRNVDPRLGSLADFDAMMTAAHGAGINVIVDIVPNHSSNRHVWFQDALRSQPGSPERARYHFVDGAGENGELPPSDWQSHFGGPAWTRVTADMADGTAIAGQWYLHLFASEQPDWNWDNPEVREDFLTTLRFWCDRGVDGFRVDVAHALAKDMSKPLRSKPELEIKVDDGSDPLFDRDDVHEIFAQWRTVLNEYDPPRTAVAEAWVPFPDRQSLYARPTGLGQAFNFDLLLAHFDAAEFHSTIAKCLSEAAASGASSTWVFSNHDVVRHASRYGLPDGFTIEDQEAWLLSNGTTPPIDPVRGLRRARAATLVMLALPGCAYMYQGEELGLFEVAELPAEVLQDPMWARTGNKQKGRDGCRVPLPWTVEGPTFGFNDGTASTWLPQPGWFGQHAVGRQSGAAGSTLELYRSALAARRSLQSQEALEWLGTDADVAAGVLHFARPNGWQVVANFSSQELPMPAKSEGAVVVLSSAALPPAGLEPDSVLAAGTVLPAETTVWLAPAR